MLLIQDKNKIYFKVTTEWAKLYLAHDMELQK